MFNRKQKDKNHHEDLSKYLHRYGVSAAKAQAFESKMTEISPADYFLPDSDDVYVGYNTPSDLELGVLSQIVQNGLATILDPNVCSPVIARLLFGPPGLATEFEVAARDLFYSRVAAFTLTSVGPSTFRACYAAYHLRELIKSRSVTMKVISNSALTLYRVVITSVGSQTMVYDPFINPTRVFTEKYHKRNILHLYPEPDEVNPIYQFSVTPEVCADLSKRLSDIQETMRILLTERNDLERFMNDDEYLASLQSLDMLSDDHEDATAYALEYLANKIKLPKAAHIEPLQQKRVLVAPPLEAHQPAANAEEVLPSRQIDLDLSLYIAREIDDDRPLCLTKYHTQLTDFSDLMGSGEKQKEVSMALFSEVVAGLRKRSIDVTGRLPGEDDGDCRMWIDAAMFFVCCGVRNSFCMTAISAFMIDKIFYSAALERNRWDKIPVVTIMEAGIAGRYVVAIGRMASDECTIYDPLHDASRVMSIKEYEQEVFVQAGKPIGVVNTCMLIGHGERAQFFMRLRDEYRIKDECKTYQQIQKKLITLFAAAPVLPKKGDSVDEVAELIEKVFFRALESSPEPNEAQARSCKM